MKWTPPVMLGWILTFIRMGVYALIQKLEPKPKTITPGSIWTLELIEETFAGTGVGRKSVGQIIKDHGVDPKTVYRRLKRGGIEAMDNDKIKEGSRRQA